MFLELFQRRKTSVFADFCFSCMCTCIFVSFFIPILIFTHNAPIYQRSNASHNTVRINSVTKEVYMLFTSVFKKIEFISHTWNYIFLRDILLERRNHRKFHMSIMDTFSVSIKVSQLKI